MGDPTQPVVVAASWPAAKGLQRTPKPAGAARGDPAFLYSLNGFASPGAGGPRPDRPKALIRRKQALSPLPGALLGLATGGIQFTFRGSASCRWRTPRRNRPWATASRP